MTGLVVVYTTRIFLWCSDTFDEAASGQSILTLRTYGIGLLAKTKVFLIQKSLTAAGSFVLIVWLQKDLFYKVFTGIIHVGIYCIGN